jgi:hypothetical protein
MTKPLEKCPLAWRSRVYGKGMAHFPGRLLAGFPCKTKPTYNREYLLDLHERRHVRVRARWEVPALERAVQDLWLGGMASVHGTAALKRVRPSNAGA